MTEDVAPDDLGKRSAAAGNGDAGAGAEGMADKHVGGSDMGGGAVVEPIWRDGDYIGGKQLHFSLKRADSNEKISVEDFIFKTLILFDD